MDNGLTFIKGSVYIIICTKVPPPVVHEKRRYPRFCRGGGTRGILQMASHEIIYVPNTYT